jgi:hypothetical protein
MSEIRTWRAVIIYLNLKLLVGCVLDSVAYACGVLG